MGHGSKRAGYVEGGQEAKRRKLDVNRGLLEDDPSESGSEITPSVSSSPISTSTADIVNFRVSSASVAALAAKNIHQFFPIQEKTFDSIYDGHHVIGRARTGTGKTLAFALPTIERLLAADGFSKNGRRHEKCRMLVLLPTRELAQQVAAEFEMLECRDRFGTSTAVGGLPDYPQIQSIKSRGNVVVGTPGRVLDFLNRGILCLKKLKTFVLDEADQMLEMGFKDDVDQILQFAFKNSDGDNQSKAEGRLQVLLFTATLPSWVKSVSEKYMTGREKVVVDVVKEGSVQTATGVQHLNIVCGFHQRSKSLADVLALYGGMTGKSIVFTETKAQANQLAVDSGISHFCQVLHGDIQQKQREITLRAFKAGKFRCLVATDVAARGLHVDDVSLVVQMDPPKDIDTFVHRAGRTGRAGTTGTNIVYFTMQDAPFLMSIEKATGIKFRRVAVPQPDNLAKAAAQRIADGLISIEGGSQYLQFKPIAERLIGELGPEEAVCRLLNAASGCGNKSSSSPQLSALTGREGHKAYEMVFKHVDIQSKGYIWKALKNVLGENEDMTDSFVSMILRKDGKGCVFDVPPEVLKKWEKAVEVITANPKNLASFTLRPLFDIPELHEPFLDSSMASNSFDTRNPRAVGRRQNAQNGGRSGGNRGARNGGGPRGRGRGGW